MDEIPEADRIERDLAKTRARMDDRLDELQDHLSPAQMINDAFAYFRGGDGAEFTQELMARVKANPIPVAVTAVGIAWLIGSNHRVRSAPPAPRNQDLESRLRAAEGSVVRFPGEQDEAFTARLDEALGRVLGVRRASTDTPTSYSQRVEDALEAATEGLREKTQDLSAGVKSAFSWLRNGAVERGVAIQEGSQDMVRSARDAISTIATNPLALGAIAALVGVLAGSLLPTLDEEEATLGSIATKLRTAGKDVAQDLVDRGGRIASDTLGAVADSAQAHDLTGERSVGDLVEDLQSGALVGGVKEVVHETLQASKESLQAHLSGGGEKASAPKQR